MSTHSRGGAMLPPKHPANHRIEPSQSAFQPPPSSIALVVESYSRNNEGLENLPGRDVFQQLLQELFAEQNEATDAADDVGRNHILIPIITAAGLNILLEDDPFSSPRLTEELLKQATNSLLVIQITIQRTPQVLFCAPPQENSQSEQLFLGLWLLPRLFALLSHQPVHSLVLHILNTIIAIFEAGAKDTKHWVRLRAILNYCTACFGGIIAAFKSKELAQLSSRKKFELELPTEDFTIQAAVWNGQSAFDPQSVRFSVRDYDHAATLAVHIFALFYRLWPPPTNTALQGAIDLLPSLQHGLSEIWKAMASWDSITLLCEKTHGIRLQIMTELDVALDNIPYTGRSRLDGLHLFAVRCIADVLQRPITELSHPCERAVAGILLSLLCVCHKAPLVHEMLKDHLFPIVFALIEKKEEDSCWKVLSHDLQVAMIQLSLSMADQAGCKIVLAKQKAISSNEICDCKDEVLQSKLQHLKDQNALHSNDGTIGSILGNNSRKPRIIDKPIEEPSLVNQRLLVRDLCRKFGLVEATDLSGLSVVIGDGFKKLNDAERAWTVNSIGILACAMPGSLREEQTRYGIEYECDYCDSTSLKLVKRQFAYANDSELLKALSVLTGMQEFNGSRKLRCDALRAYERLMNHTQDRSFQTLGESSLGNWCLGRLDSSMRELRIAASRALQAFVRPDLERRLLDRNWQYLMDFLRDENNLSADRSKLETSICTWGQLGRVAQDKELNLVLIKLVDYLSDSSSFNVGVALGEMSEVARAHNVSPRRLFAPFWRTISTGVVEKTIKKPQVIRLLTDFVSMDVNEFLRLTQNYTLPYMILYQRHDIIARIAEASRKGGATVQGLCHANMAYILAILFIQDYKNSPVEGMSKALLEKACEKYRNVSLEELVRPDAIPTAAELLKQAGDAGNHNEVLAKRIHAALVLVAKLGSKKASPKTKITDPLGHWFDQNILGLCTLFGENLKEPVAQTSILEKIRCLKAMKEMLTLAHGAVSSALPQICACLQSALEVEGLRAYAVDAWAALMTAVENAELISLLGQTFSLTLQYWEAFDEAAQKHALDMIDRLFSHDRKVLKQHVDLIPELNVPHPRFQEYEKKLRVWRNGTDIPDRLKQLALRCSHENAAVVEHALDELQKYLRQNEDFIHSSAINEKPHPVLPELLRTLLDVVMLVRDSEEEIKLRIKRLCGECLGLIGAVDADLVEAQREKREIVVIHNFSKAEESCDFVMFFLERIVVKAFLSATDTKAQGFLAWASQELLKFCDIQETELARKNNLDRSRKPQQDRWNRLSAAAKDTLAPFLSSKYMLQPIETKAQQKYPIYNPKMSYREWIVTFLNDLLPRAHGNNATSIFATCMRICKGQDVSISNFLFPFVVVHIVICGSLEERANIKSEFLEVLRHKGDLDNAAQQDTLRNCCEAIFSAIDYCTRWLREKKEYNNATRNKNARNQNRYVDENAEEISDIEISRVSEIISAIPPDLMGERSLQFKSYARALQYWETHIRNMRTQLTEVEMEPLYEQLQRIYSFIDEPDGIEGISAKISNLDEEQQVLEHRKAGRWNPVQSWYELLLAEQPDNMDTQVNLLTALRDSGQNESLLNQIDAMMQTSPSSISHLLPYSVEASWLAGNWRSLDKYLSMTSENARGYDINLGRALRALQRQDMDQFRANLVIAREEVIGMMTETATGSVRQCHDLLVKLHGLAELQEITTSLDTAGYKEPRLLKYLQSRLDVMGSYSRDKQYILALRRAVFALSRKPDDALKENIVMAWLGTAQLARKGNQPKLAFNAIHHATRLSGPLALIEHSKLLWQQGQTKNAIRNLEGAIEKKILEFDTEDMTMYDSKDSNSSIVSTSTTSSDGKDRVRPQNKRVAKARLLLAKWVDRSGRTHASEILENYTEASAWYTRWEQGFYYIGRHYNSLLEAERQLQPEQQSQAYLHGQMAKSVCQNYIRALAFGTKYIFLTVPRMLTLWMDLGDLVIAPDQPDGRRPNPAYVSNIKKYRERTLIEIHRTQAKYIPKLSPWMFFIAFPQIMSRITHPHKDVFEHLMNIIMKVLIAYPQQAVWSLACVIKSTHKERANRGAQITRKLQSAPLSKKITASGTKSDINIQILIKQANKLTDNLLKLSNAEIGKHVVRASISRDLNFMHSCAPCDLVLPTQAILAISMPSSTGGTTRLHNPFAPQQPTIQQFNDECEVMNSLQKPRRITIRGSDGLPYHFLCKPKDDLRKDARLMEFNSMINRFLKKDPDTRKRSLYIRTYCVTPLNEECGLIEWVNNVRTLRDIILKSYKVKQVTVNYTTVLELLNEACKDSASATIFTDQILPMFPPVFYEWFLVMFSEPAAWFEARLRYTRTSAVMSMVGTILGLGDRHGENILFDTKNGDTLHVDFNCLFDKGLSFDKPERVPFRLTQNMLDAFGSAGYEGVFRKACEGAMRLLRHNEETMMTVLEAFIHDPAVDMVGKKKGGSSRAPDTPKEILESISRRLKGLWEDGTVPLSVEGQVENLIRKAVDPGNLCRMYIGWSPMF